MHMKPSVPSLKLLCGLLLLAVSPLGAADKTNLVFILADDLGWADTTLYGHTRYYKTPHLERLAKRGMTFTRAYSASPLCSPTRASILTGLSPARLGLTTPNCHVPQVVLQASTGKKAAPGQKAIQPDPVTRLLTTYQTLGKTMKAAGYATGHFGKWHLGPDPYSPLQQGFDVDLPHTAGPGPAGSYVAPWKYKGFDPDPAIPDEHIEDRMAREATAFLEKNKDRPFFLNYWMFSVHAPFDAKEALIEKYRATANPDDPQRSPTYAAMIESMDDAVGTLLDTLDRLQLTEKTMIVFYSDNGGNMYNDVDGTTATSNAPLRGGKATVYEGGIRVPCIVSLPGTTAPGSRSDTVVQSTDFFPTLVESLHLPPPAGVVFDGISIVPALKGQPLQREAIFTYFPHDPPVPDWLPPSVVVTQGDWKLIRLFFQGEAGAHRWQLFNLRDDPGEKSNLAAKEPARVQQMDVLIEKFLTETKAVQPIPNPQFDPSKHQPQIEGIGRMREGGKATAKAPAPAVGAENNPQLQGWKARNCSASVKDGIVTLTSGGSSPFLGVGANAQGPAVVKLRVRAAGGGDGKVEWLAPGRAAAAAQAVPFSLKPGDWQELSVKLPAEEPWGILRVYLPAQTQPVEVDWIELETQAKPRRWEF